MIKRILSIVITSLVACLLASCSDAEHSVEWYKQNKVERNNMLEKCKADADLTLKNKNCQNAGDADFLS